MFQNNDKQFLYNSQNHNDFNKLKANALAPASLDRFGSIGEESNSMNKYTANGRLESRSKLAN